MTTASALFDAYLDINILLILVCTLWFAISAGLRVLGLSHSFTAQLRLLRTVFLVIVASPVLLFGYGAAMSLVSAAPAPSVNLSDFIVAQYLQGRFEMNPSALESLLGARARLTYELARPTSAVALWLYSAALLGAGFFLARLVLSMVKLGRIIGESFVWRRFGRVELRLSDTTTVPFSTRTLGKRLIVLPSSMLAESADLRIALGHEMQHLRQHDVEWEIVLEFLKPVFFWNPAYYIWKRQVEQLRELACDRQVLLRKGYGVADYCQCLLRVCHNSLRRRRLFAVQAPVVALVQTENRLFGQRSAQFLKRRMVSLIDGKAEAHSTVLFACLIVPLIVLTLGASLAIQRPGDWSHDRLMLSTIINLERVAVTNSAPTFGSPEF